MRALVAHVLQLLKQVHAWHVSCNLVRSVYIVYIMRATDARWYQHEEFLAGEDGAPV